MLDEHCKKHIENSLGRCERINRRVPASFCQLMCQGDWEKHYREDIEVLRERHRQPLEEIQQSPSESVHVIIPCCNEKIEWIDATIRSVFDNACGTVCVEILFDGSCSEETCVFAQQLRFRYGVRLNSIIIPASLGNIGQRKIMNFATRFSGAEYILRLDGHCLMSPEWDARMKASCKDETIVVTTFDSLDKNTFTPLGSDMSLAVLKPNLRKKFVRNWKDIPNRATEEETMTFTGTSWMIRRDYYWKLGGCDESLGKYGALGVEWALKTWLTGGRVIMRTDVVCYHLFRLTPPFKVNGEEIRDAFARVKHQWVDGNDPRITRPYEWLVKHFWPWSKARGQYIMKDSRRAVVPC